MPRIGIGIDITKNSGGILWPAYWATLISATVENAAPTDVVLTFPSPAAIVASDLSVAGFTVSSASWTGNVLTLVLSYPVTIYNGNLTITFITTGGTATVTNNVTTDGKAIGWWDAQEGVTKDGSNTLTRWNSKLGVANDDFVTIIGTPKWSAGGILFNGINSGIRTGSIYLNQPEFYYLVTRIVTYNSGYFFDGANDQQLLYMPTPSPVIKAFAGTHSSANSDMVVGAWTIIRVLYNGANSKLQVGDNDATVGNFGTTGIVSYIALGAKNGNQIFGNVEFKEVIVRNNDDTGDIETSIYNYLKTKYAFFLSD